MSLFRTFASVKESPGTFSNGDPFFYGHILPDGEFENIMFY